MEEKFQLSQLVDMTDPEAVLKEVLHLGTLISPGFDQVAFTQTFGDIQRLFDGTYPGYQACNTEYHDFAHTYEVTLAMSRLMHGAFSTGMVFSGQEVQVGMTAALMHDTGYIQETADHAGTGAKYTLIHIARSVEFLREYCRRRCSSSEEEMKDFADILFCTGLSVKIDEIEFSSDVTAMLGKMLGTADLLGQMADRLYLEKLLFLYREFAEGGLSQFADESDLLQKTVGFYEISLQRFAREFSGVDRYMIHHFRNRWGKDHDLYRESIQRNIDYLKDILADHRKDITGQLKRGYLVKKLVSR
jgi:hypothetical protein